MRKYVLVNMKSINAVLTCFASQDELDEFRDDFGILMEDLIFANQLAIRDEENEEFVNFMAFKQLFLVGMFMQKNVELLHSLMKAVVYKEISEEEKEKYEINEDEEFLL